MIRPAWLTRPRWVALAIVANACALVLTFAPALVPALYGCNAGPPPANVPNPKENCAAAGDRLRALECKSETGLPLWQTPDGTPFAAACEYAARDGRNWYPHCIKSIRSCEELEAAYRGKRCP